MLILQRRARLVQTIDLIPGPRNLYRQGNRHDNHREAVDQKRLPRAEETALPLDGMAEDQLGLEVDKQHVVDRVQEADENYRPPIAVQSDHRHGEREVEVHGLLSVRTVDEQRKVKHENRRIRKLTQTGRAEGEMQRRRCGRKRQCRKHERTDRKNGQPDPECHGQKKVRPQSDDYATLDADKIESAIVGLPALRRGGKELIQMITDR